LVVVGGGSCGVDVGATERVVGGEVGVGEGVVAPVVVVVVVVVVGGGGAVGGVESREAFSGVEVFDLVDAGAGVDATVGALWDWDRSGAGAAWGVILDLGGGGVVGEGCSIDSDVGGNGGNLRRRDSERGSGTPLVDDTGRHGYGCVGGVGYGTWLIDWFDQMVLNWILGVGLIVAFV
jgi:hypothetical protein